MSDTKNKSEQTLDSPDHLLHPAPLAYFNPEFLNSPDGRILRIMSEYAEPLSRFRREKIQDTVVFFGSARFASLSETEKALTILEKPGSARPAGPEDLPGGKDGDALQTALKRAHAAVEMSRFYEDARKLAHMLTEWTVTLPGKRRRFVVTSGGGPGIMEAANRGAHEAGGKTIGLNIRLPFEQFPNPYITPELNFEFHYFFMRKYWFAYLAKALVVFPGGFGTLDELFEILTLAQTQKLAKKIIVIVYGKEYWSRVLNLEALADAGAISPDDTQLFSFCDSPEEAFECLKDGLTKYHLQPPPARLVPEEGPEIAKTLP
ncbi:MAG TPA: TIGR00730 family Rossman fold protein [Candidatus Acidoferrales bacterium]|nr:TIGR00730 family Rossman fold protein [Candidatus Acidoferrales bacterium]